METVQCLLLYRLRIQTSVGRKVLGDEDSKCGLFLRAENRVRALKKPPTTPEQCQFSLCPEMALMQPRLALSMLSCRWWLSVPTSEVLG